MNSFWGYFLEWFALRFIVLYSLAKSCKIQKNLPPIKGREQKIIIIK